MVKKLKVNEPVSDFEKNVACIGYFDALHRGHQKLIETAIAIAEKSNTRSMLICFEPDPMQLITGVKQKHILSYSERIHKIKDLGIDDIVVFRFDDELMRLDPVSFIQDYLNRMNIQVLICGFDFHFGYQGNGSSRTLKKYADFDLQVIPEITYYGKKISSSRIRKALSQGNIRLANRLLNYEYYLPLKVTKSSKKGLKWLIEAEPADDSKIIPSDINSMFGNIRYIEGRFYFDSDEDMLPGQIYNIVFENE